MSDFHFLRPWWLLALIPAAALAWRLWSIGDAAHAWRGVVAPHLLPHLLVGAQRRHRVRPIHWLLVAWVLAAVALAGPAWQREPVPFADDQAALVVVLKVTPSMLAQDVQPTRLARAVQKVHDLLKLRPGAKTALVAYAGSAHRVLPPTRDGDLLVNFASELSPSVMPVEGDVAADALKLADAILKESGQAGWLLWAADAAPTGLAAPHAPVSVLAVAGDGPERDSLKAAASGIGAEFVPVTPDDADVQRLAGRTHFAPAAAADGGERWRDAGYWLVPVVAILSLLWFRPGWIV